METKKGLWPGRSHYVSMTEPGGEKLLCCFFSAPLGLNKKWHMPCWMEKGVIFLPNSGQVLCYRSELCFSSKIFFQVADDQSCFLSSITHQFYWKEWATLDVIKSSSKVTHTILFSFSFFLGPAHHLVQPLANITIAVGANDPRVQSPLCSLSHSHLMTSWLDVCIKQMWLAMRGLKQDRTAYSL